MKNTLELTPQDIKELNYVEFISFLRETNRCPGGKNTIRKVIQNTFLNERSRVLEVGSNTGFTALELARTAKCSVIGIEPVQSAVIEANRELSEDTLEIQKRVQFQLGNAYDLQFEDNSFDLVDCRWSDFFHGRKIKSSTRVSSSDQTVGISVGHKSLLYQDTA